MIPVPLSLPDTLTPLTSTKILKAGGGEFIGKSAKGMALLYSLKGLSPVGPLHLADHSLDGCIQFFRSYYGELADCTIERISHLNGAYSNLNGVPILKPGGVGHGLFISANTKLTNLTIRSIIYRGVEPITNPGDVYPVIGLGGKDANDIGSNFLFEDLDFDGMWASYAGYQNCDAIAIEAGYTDGIIRRCKFSNGSDAGLDRKALRWTADDVTVTNFRESYKTWANTQDGALTSINPRSAHYMVMNGAEHTIGRVVARGDPKSPLFKFENAPGIARVLGDLDIPEGQVLAAGVKGSKIIINGVETVI
jgi:hypothetical protein